jgi:phage/plasmid-like protein (TIGR03299 family)
MAHLLEKMAYIDEIPWHGLGNALPPKQPIEVWAQRAGMDWDIRSTSVRFWADARSSIGYLRSFDRQKVLFRSDTKTALSVVSSRYRVVQPREVLEFYRDLTEVSGFALETAGVLKEGRRFWALARTGKEASLKGNDVVKGYILLATSCDGSLATVATPTTIRVVCNNTLTMALNGAVNGVKVPHSTTFDAQLVKQHLGLAVSQWDTFMYRMKALAERKVKRHEAQKYFLNVISAAEGDATTGKVANEGALKRVQSLYEADGQGAGLASARGTAWGLLNAVTQYVDHEKRARNKDYRLDSAWFGAGAALKQRALDQALLLTT